VHIGLILIYVYFYLMSIFIMHIMIFNVGHEVNTANWLKMNVRICILIFCALCFKQCTHICVWSGFNTWL